MTLTLKETTPEYYYNTTESIHGLISAQAQKFPGTVAIKHNKVAFTYKELDAASNQIAAFLNENKIIKGDVIAVAMDRSIQMATCLLAAMKAGATYLPIDPNLPIERVDFLIKDSGATRLIVSEKYTSLFATYPDKIIFDDVWANREAYPADFPAVETGDDDLVYIIYTSGSTGFPKGVGVAHKGLINLLQFRLHTPGVSNIDNMLGITTMSFDIAEEELYLPLICGAMLTIVDMEVARDGSALLEIINTEHITIMQATPYIWQMMLESGWNSMFPIKAFCGGEALTNELAGKLLERCDEVWNMYGPTETTICTIVKKITKADELITIGKPIDNMQVYILDENQNKVMPGTEGELYISGVGVNKGYINRPDLTAEKFIDDKFSDTPGQKMYRTGDLGKVLKNGDIQFLGRIDSQIKLRGYRIETEEIEYQLKLNENVKNALVTVHEDAVKNLRLVAYIVPLTPVKETDASAWTDSLKAELSKVLPDHMVPGNYEIITEVPLLPSGKINIKALPAPRIKDNAAKYAAPATELEKTLVGIWENNIGIKHIGVTDNFFELGGSSLIAVKTKVQIEKLTKKRLSPSVLFKYPTIQQLVVAINGASPELYKSLIPIKPEGSKIPLYLVHGIGLNVLNFRCLVLNLDADQPVYGLQAINIDELDEPLDTIEKTAAFYNKEILMSNPTGPYAIAGYSIGGVIGYEMVKQLKAAGKEVKLLAMFDTAVQTPTHQYPFFKKTAAKALRQFPKLKFRLTTFIKQPKETIKYLNAVYSKQFARGFHSKHDTYGLPDYMQATVINLKEAFNHYKIEPVDVHIDLFVAKKLYFLDDPINLGWKKYALKGIGRYMVSSNHDTMFSAPHYKDIASQMQKLLNAIND
ncbi:MAG TPA: amino acid adenylation domain-containing protein [Mucilaginibacter sp.]|jgi:amino acid adenylation domain-containing protein|nr:amino acid adenylation domain-containing protein [Mucilaginibacter sp.]